MDGVLKKLNEMNPGKDIISVDDESFRKYGTIHKRFKIDNSLKYLEKNNKASDDVVYFADVPEVRKELGNELEPVIYSIYGGLDVQVGRCLAKNNKLNALEYHQGSETYISGTDMIMLLGLDNDIKWPEGKYDISRIKAFYAPKGSVIELKGGCMHFVGVNVYSNQGINVIVMLLKNTNTNIELLKPKQGQDMLLSARNTWFIAHPEYTQSVEAGQHIGLTGENMVFKTL
jgi:hypothetical protein